MAPESRPQPKVPQSRFAANSAFQRQLSSQALQLAASKQKADLQQQHQQHSSSTPTSQPPHRLFQRQMTSSQLPISGEAKSKRQAGQSQPISGPRNTPVAGADPNREKKAKQKRIISRMLSISTIHTTLTESAAASFMKDLQLTDSQAGHSEGGHSGVSTSSSNQNNCGASTTTATTSIASDQMPGEMPRPIHFFLLISIQQIRMKIVKDTRSHKKNINFI